MIIDKGSENSAFVAFPNKDLYEIISAAIIACFVLTSPALATIISGTDSDNIIYFGYNDTCFDGDGGLVVCILNENEDPIDPRNFPRYYKIKETETLAIKGKKGDDLIQFVANEPKVGVFFDNDLKLKFNSIHIGGDSGNDRLLGVGDNCVISGDSGNDYLYGNRGNQTLVGGLDNDVLLGGNGNDILYGDRGNDVLVGGNGLDRIHGGAGSDTYRCRNPASPKHPYDYDCGDPTTDCGDTIEIDVEFRNSKDPYVEWAGLTFNANGINYHMLTTSNPALLRNDRSSGAKILMNGNEPLRVSHKQYAKTCGPSSLNPVLEYLGIADPDRRLKLIYDLEHEDMTLQADRSRMADVGYFGSTENIMYLGYRINPAESRKKTSAENPDYFITTRTSANGNIHYFLNLSTRNTDDLSFYEIPYTMNYDGNVQSWVQYGAPVGGDELPKVANNYFPPIKNAAFVDIISITQLKNTVKEFIDHDIPTVVAVDDGGHFNTLIGYWESGNNFYIYTADPLDGYGQEFSNQPMRWRKMKITQDAIDSGEIKQILVFDYPKLIDGGIYNFKCLGHIEGNRWLDGRTQDSTVGLVPVTTGGYTGTKWQAIEIEPGIYNFKCLGHIEGNRWLDGRTQDSTVGLVPTTTGGYTGTKWQAIEIEPGIYNFKCLGHIEGNRWLDGRTQDGTVGLVPVTTGGYTGTKWQLFKVDYPKLINGGIYNFKCLGHIEGNRWLDGRTQDSTVGLVPTTTGGYTGTKWQAIEIEPGIYSFKCLGHIEGNRWLDGRTQDSTVGLVPTTTGGYTGTRWQAIEIEPGIYNFKCLGHIEGNRWLDGRTQDSTVGLVPTTTGGYTGTKWQAFKVG